MVKSGSNAHWEGRGVERFALGDYVFFQILGLSVMFIIQIPRIIIEHTILDSKGDTNNSSIQASSLTSGIDEQPKSKLRCHSIYIMS